jgi:hypothetical protein
MSEMRTMLALTGAAFGLVLSANLAAPAQAGETATRCGQYGCDQVRCHDRGDSCTRYSDYDSYYNGYTNGAYGGSYGGYDNYGDDDQVYDGAYGGYGSGYGSYGGYDNGARVVCDSAGTRCYQSSTPYWDYHEYYRVHGYRWNY